ncbi:hypothetical protein BLX87_21975, partial [Bacillus sp. VT-16-64]
GDSNVPIADLLVRPAEKLNDGKGYRHPHIPLPAKIYGKRTNSAGVELGDRKELAALLGGIAKASRTVNAVPLIDGVKAAGKAQNVISPVNGATVGTVVFATADEAAKAVGIAKRAFVSWSRVPVETRA